MMFDPERLEHRPPIILVLLILAVLILAVLVHSVMAIGQSGRRKDQATKSGAAKTGPSPTPVAETGPERSSSTRPRVAIPAKPASDEEDSSDIVRISSNLVPIPASVVDSGGYALADLQLQDFELRVDGEIRPISDLSRSETPVRLAMLFDNSGSLDQSRDLEKHAAMKFFGRVMRPVDQAAIYSVATESYLAQPLTNDIGKLEQTISGFGKPEGATSLFDAIVEAAGYLRPYKGRKVIVIVSDGIETTSRADFDTTMQRVLGDDCQIYVVQTGLYDNANVRALTAERRMEQFAVQTGGAAYMPKVTSDLDVAFSQIGADLAQQYVLSYYPSGERRDGRYHTLALRVITRQRARVRARKGYYSPKA